MSEIIDKYKEPLEGEPAALSEQVELKKQDFSEKAPVAEKAPVIEDKPVSKEREILELERKLAEKKAELSKEVPMPDRDPEPEGLGEKIEKEPAAPAAKSSSKIQDQIKKLKGMKRSDQVKTLCNLAFSQDLDFAIDVAKGLDNAYVLDEFHDSLVDELYDKLVEQGELKKM